MDNKDKKRDRGTNYSPEEKEILMDLVKLYNNKIENKRTDLGTCKEKSDAWQHITVQFNAQVRSDSRSQQQLRNLYDNLKRNARKQMATENRQRYEDLGVSREEVGKLQKASCIGEDFLYRHSVSFDNVTTEVEILDTCKCAKNGCLFEHLRWGEAFVVVYAVSDRHSFYEAQEILRQLSKLKLPSYYTTLLLGNKRDLDHSRQICVDDGQELSLQYGCQFYEVSAAENFAGVSLAFQSLLREARAVQLLKALPIRRKLGVNSVSKVLGNIFGKNSKGDRKKRPSLSI